MAKTAPGDGQTNPFGNGKGGAAGKAPPFDQNAQSNPQKPYQPELATAQTPAGGTMLYADPPNAASSDDVGTKATGNRPPFRLKG